MADYAKFLAARWDELEEAAKRAAFGWGPRWRDVPDANDDWFSVRSAGNRVMVGSEDADVICHIAMQDPQAVLDDIAAKRKILEWHENWPVLTETRPGPTAYEDFDVDAVGRNLNSVVFHMSRELAWLTEREYVAKFGAEPPTGPILRMLAEPFRDHPEHPDAQAL